MVPVILSGGSGSRLWPVSRESYPKQFCEFFDRSFLQQTMDRLAPLGTPYIVTLKSMVALTQRVSGPMGMPDANLLLEPLPKNTAVAIALLVHCLQQRGKSNEVVGIFPADHLISDNSLFLQACREGEIQAQKDRLVILGIEPRYAATGYGYIEVDASQKSKGPLATYPVKQFREKPDLDNAQKFLNQGGHFWNAGVFIFKVSLMAQLLQKHMPETWRRVTAIKSDFSNLNSVYANLTAQSLDYGVLEKERDNILCMVADFGWSDVGSWDELARLQDEKVNVDSKAQVVTHDSSGNFVYSSSPKVIGLCGVEQLIVVETPDALLVSRRGHSQNVKNLVDSMREARIPQATEHSFEVRPWGGFEVLSDLPDHKVKRLRVDPGAQLSMQRHKKRDESWVVISGEAEIVLEDKTVGLKAGDQCCVTRGKKHRIKNPTDAPLILVEVQTGEYFGEDDIERFADDYKRINFDST